MAYLRQIQHGKTGYFYIMRSVRKGKTVTGKILEYLGKNPPKARIERACEYWGVKGKPAKGKGRK